MTASWLCYNINRQRRAEDKAARDNKLNLARMDMEQQKRQEKQGKLMPPRKMQIQASHVTPPVPIFVTQPPVTLGHDNGNDSSQSMETLVAKENVAIDTATYASTPPDPSTVQNITDEEQNELRQLLNFKMHIKNEEEKLKDGNLIFRPRSGGRTQV
eukprot:8055048-Ditylum_brightwellii.AAC.1